MVLLNFCNKNRQEFMTRILPTKLPIFWMLLMDWRVTFYWQILALKSWTFLHIHHKIGGTLWKCNYDDSIRTSDLQFTVVFFVVNNRHLERGEEVEKMLYFSKDQELCKIWPIFCLKRSHSCFGFATYRSILNCDAEWQVF